MSRKFDEEHFTIPRDTTVEIPDYIKFFLAKTPFANNIECKYSNCYNKNDEMSDRTHYPVLATIHNKNFKISIEKNEYHPISFEKHNKETKTNLIPKYKPKLKSWILRIIEKDNLKIEKNQKGPYTNSHDDDCLRLLNNIKTNQKPNFENVNIRYLL